VPTAITDASADRVAVGSRSRIAGKAIDRQALLERQVQALQVAGGELLDVLLFAVIDRSDRVKTHLAGSLPAPVADRRSRRAPPDLAAFLHDGGPAGAVDRPIDPAAPRQLTVCRVNNRVGDDLGDVVLDEIDRGGHCSPG
jgi:hypothetical protein